MAKIISKEKLTKAHKEHKCLDGFPFIKGLFMFVNYCPKCGESLLEEKEATEYSCSECGQILFSFGRYFKHQYCPNCGVKFEEQ